MSVERWAADCSTKKAGQGVLTWGVPGKGLGNLSRGAPGPIRLANSVFYIPSPWKFPKAHKAHQNIQSSETPPAKKPAGFYLAESFPNQLDHKLSLPDAQSLGTLCGNPESQRTNCRDRLRPCGRGENLWGLRDVRLECHPRCSTVEKTLSVETSVQIP